MVRMGKVDWKRGRKRNFQSKDKGSDDSDKDYLIEEEEEDKVSDDGDDSEEDYCFTDGDELEENLDDFEEEEREQKVKKVVRSKAQTYSTNKRKVGHKTSRKRRRVSYNEKDDEDEYDKDYDEDDDKDYDEDDKEFMPEEVGSVDEEEDLPVRRKRVSYNEEKENDEDEDEEEDYDFDDEDDEEFTPEEIDSVDEEEDVPVKKKMTRKKVGRRVLSKKGSVKTQKSKRNSKVLKKPSGKRGRRKFTLRRKVKCDGDGSFTIKNSVNKKKRGRRKNRLSVPSDSDFVSSGSSDHDFTISEEEREQVREAGKLCRSLTASLRSSSSAKRIEEDVDLRRQRKAPVRKGKEKVEDVKDETVKQVCGICLSEEGKRTVRGALNCCSHYFCFACIMEWSKVESRCPLCKQRFVTISKPARSNAGIDLRDVLVQVPERDQIYQPSEEEIRGYLDPYEHVICTECHEGGEDSLMLLCDLCDSPAHTFCVGLGREVPEGNWYCEGCRPVALASLNSLAQDSLPDQRTRSINLSHRSSPFENTGQGLDPNSLPSPFAQYSFGIGGLSSPRYPVGDVHLVSPRSGTGASTLSGRRWIHRQIHSFINSSRMRHMVGRYDEASAANLENNYPSSQVDGIETTYEHTGIPEAGTSYYNFLGQRVHNNPPLVQNGIPFPASSIRRQVNDEMISTTSQGYAQGTLWTGINAISGPEQLQPITSRSSIESDVSVPQCALGEASHFYTEKEQIQTMVQGHLKSLSRDLSLGHDTDTFKDITSKSTHTILAACGFEHQMSEVCPLQQQPPVCPHVETTPVQQMSLMKGYCSPCFETYVRDVVKTILNGNLPHFLRVRD